MTELVIYNCNNTPGLPRREVDDGLTLLYVLGQTDIHLLGVTTTCGNGPVDQAYSQTVWLLKSLGVRDLPIFRGASARGEMNTPAACLPVENAAAYPGEITVLAKGPFGNLRAAAEMASSFLPNLKGMACRGGYVLPLRIGWRSGTELNLSADPEAAHAILDAPCPVTPMNAHVCLQAPFAIWVLPRIARWPRDLLRAVAYWLLAFGLVHCGVGASYLWDLLPPVYPSVSELTDSHRARVLSGIQDLKTGTLVVADTAVEQPAIRMPSRITHRRRLKTLLFKAWGRALSLDGG